MTPTTKIEKLTWFSSCLSFFSFDTNSCHKQLVIDITWNVFDSMATPVDWQFEKSKVGYLLGEPEYQKIGSK